jgi:2-polyprenyl-6-methoxyphenol hydroxylase-like FAD-dependent oxidoreductase
MRKVTDLSDDQRFGRENMEVRDHYDVVIIGAGLAGLSLAQQLLLNSDKTILLVEKRAEIPPKRQKVGESLVQVGGYYFSKVLDLEEYLLREHYMKYNLRFYWKSTGRENRSFEDYSQAYIRTFSNIPCYQLDRNKIEGELLRRNSESPNFTFCAPATDLSVSLSDDGPHSLTFKINGCEVPVKADWVIDASGRGKFLARRMGLEQPNPIRHGTSFLWVDGLVDIDKLTNLAPKELRLKRDRSAIGHLPLWLATNHFCGEGFWFWVIPLQGKTSLGLVYDNTIFPRERVVTPQKLIEWVCQEFPLFARDLPYRKILDYSGFKDYSYGCAQTIHPSRWALTGEAGRFTDPLYSPGSDFIATHNTLITDAILTMDPNELAAKCYLHELLAQSLYESLVPTYAISYDALGDQEAFVLKYTWELSAYFSFFVFPFINDLATNRRFVLSYLGKFSRLGAINKHLQAFISAYYQWKKSARQPVRDPLFHDFTSIGSLRTAESTFYRTDISAEEALSVLETQITNLKELARYIVAHVHSVVLSDERVLTNRSFIESIDIQDFHFDPDEMHEYYAHYVDLVEQYEWSFNPFVLSQFRTEPRTDLAEAVGMSLGQSGAE